MKFLCFAFVALVLVTFAHGTPTNSADELIQRSAMFDTILADATAVARHARKVYTAVLESDSTEVLRDHVMREYEDTVKHLEVGVDKLTSLHRKLTQMRSAGAKPELILLVLVDMSTTSTDISVNAMRVDELVQLAGEIIKKEGEESVVSSREL